jgi:uncharacterized membrane protein YfhO
VYADEMLTALADPAFDPAAEVLLEQPALHIQRQTSSTEHPAPNTQYPVPSTHYQVTLQDHPNGVTIHAILDAPGYLVLADTWYPGWQAAADGVPIEILRANHAFRAVWLEAGEHTVQMVYRPTVVPVGGAISLTALTLLVAGLPLAYRRKDQR